MLCLSCQRLSLEEWIGFDNQSIALGAYQIKPYDTASIALRGGFANLGSLILIFLLWGGRSKPTWYPKGEL
jgi:hypothetical protein